MDDAPDVYARGFEATPPSPPELLAALTLEEFNEVSIRLAELISNDGLADADVCERRYFGGNSGDSSEVRLIFNNFYLFLFFRFFLRVHDNILASL